MWRKAAWLSSWLILQFLQLAVVCFLVFMWYTAIADLIAVGGSVFND